jgi:hypothetical protein
MRTHKIIKIPDKNPGVIAAEISQFQLKYIPELEDNQ